MGKTRSHATMADSGNAELLALLTEIKNKYCYKYQMLLPSNTDRMVAKRRSKAIWTPRGKSRNSTPGLGNFGNKNWHHESSSKI
ncbi:hypothetical protein NPIL_591171 [Nephila pilipes]|uniref:Uncharacterized protein n=1 Tax=Nephila pilipes TaxID=299642 RepID=A0A8X6QUB1_NEPPI|nr:hypothetical protein NPIL_591171 [Nephila pilipes]